MRSESIYINKAFIVFNLLMMLSLVFYQKGIVYSIIPLIVLRVYTLSKFFSGFVQQKNRKIVLVCFAFFSFTCLSILWSSEIQTALSSIERKLSWVIFPFIFLFGPNFLKAKDYKKLLAFYVLSIFILCVFCHISVLKSIYFNNRSISELSTWRYTSSYLSEIVGFHPTYLTVYISFASCIILNNILSNQLLTHKVLVFIQVIIFIYFAVFNTLLASRLNLIAFFFITFFAVYKISRHFMFKKWGNLLLFSITLLLIIFFIKKSPYTISKYKQTITFMFDETHKNNSTSYHFNSWSCAYEIIKEEFWLGTGIGDSKKYLQECYSSNNFTKNFNDSHNAHNQFFEIQLSLGILGTFLFFSLLLILFKRKKFLLDLFCIIMLVSFISESILYRRAGVVFFLYFSCFLFSYPSEEKGYETSEMN